MIGTLAHGPLGHWDIGTCVGVYVGGNFFAVRHEWAAYPNTTLFWSLAGPLALGGMDLCAIVSAGVWGETASLVPPSSAELQALLPDERVD